MPKYKLLIYLYHLELAPSQVKIYYNQKNIKFLEWTCENKRCLMEVDVEIGSLNFDG